MPITALTECAPRRRFRIKWYSVALLLWAALTVAIAFAAPQVIAAPRTPVDVVLIVLMVGGGLVFALMQVIASMVDANGGRP